MMELPQQQRFCSQFMHQKDLLRQQMDADLRLLRPTASSASTKLLATCHNYTQENLSLLTDRMLKRLYQLALQTHWSRD